MNEKHSTSQGEPACPPVLIQIACLCCWNMFPSEQVEAHQQECRVGSPVLGPCLEAER